MEGKPVWLDWSKVSKEKREEEARDGAWGQTAQGLEASLTILDLTAVGSHRKILNRGLKYNLIHVLKP